MIPYTRKFAAIRPPTTPPAPPKKEDMVKFKGSKYGVHYSKERLNEIKRKEGLTPFGVWALKHPNLATTIIFISFPLYITIGLGIQLTRTFDSLVQSWWDDIRRIKNRAD